jgi:serine kinase of HPr protein (carbohydrate metabolism regulator)
MTVTEVAKNLELTCHVTGDPEREVLCGYVGDLLSWVISRAGAGSAWITIMSNPNVAAVALLADTSMIILAEGVQPDEELVSKAKQHQLGLYTAAEGAYELACKLHSLIG